MVKILLISISRVQAFFEIGNIFIQHLILTNHVNVKSKNKKRLNNWTKIGTKDPWVKNNNKSCFFSIKREEEGKINVLGYFIWEYSFLSFFFFFMFDKKAIFELFNV